MKTEEAEADKLDDTWMVHAFFLYLYSCNMAVGVQASMHHWRRGARATHRAHESVHGFDSF